ncbi:MAG: HNH endonuclease signature motif containing protein [Aeromonadaceae bacterium]
MTMEFKQHPIHLDYWFTECGSAASLKTNNLTGNKNFRVLFPNKSGRYVRVAICNGYQRKTVGLHRLVYETFNGTIPDGMEINHIDGDKHNKSLSNLELCNRLRNMEHAYDLGLVPIKAGTSHPRSKLSSEAISAIRSRILKQKEYAAMFGCHITTVQRVQHNKTYKED